MRKKLLKTLIMGSLLSLSATAFAANPFELVPTTNWTYDAIGNLVQSGVFEGYKDINFSKNQTFTRYELATFVGKALANENKANAEQKATIGKLAAEFKGELTNLGVYTAAITPAVAPAAADNFKVSGLYRVRYQHDSLFNGSNGQPDARYLQAKIQLDTTTKINDNLKANLSFEGYRDFYTDAGRKGSSSTAWGAGKKVIVKKNKDVVGSYTDASNGAFDLTVANVEGNYNGLGVTIGKFTNTFGSGLIFDDYVSGIKLQFGNKLKTTLAYSEADSNIAGNAAGGNMAKLSKAVNVDFSYDISKATTLGASFQNWTSKEPGVDSNKIYELSATSKLNKDLSAYASFDKSSYDADNKAYVIGLRYKNADKNTPGSYGAWIDYENFQRNTALDTTYWMAAGQKGIALGFDYIPAKNVKWSNVFLHAKALASNDLDLKEGQLQNFFRTQVYYYF